MPTFIDQTGRSINLDAAPRRVISIVPSQSELLWDLGLREELIGITKFCIHPDEMFRTVERVGGTKTLDLEKIRKLKPDLIIGNKEENEKSQIEELQKEFNVWMSDIFNFDDAFKMIKSLGEIVDKKSRANEIIKQLTKTIPEIENIFSHQRVVYFIWNKPYMLAGANTFIHHVLNYAGLINAAEYLERYPEVTNDQLVEMKAEYCFLSSEPFPFKEKHQKEIESFLPGVKTMIVDGELFSWYGSRLLQLPEYLKELKKKIV